MDENSILVKDTLHSEDETQEILLFYVDEASGTVESLQKVSYLPTASDYNIVNGELPNIKVEDIHETLDIKPEVIQHSNAHLRERWNDTDIKNLLTFYIDNMDTFNGGVTTKHHLWSVACKTMLPYKTPMSCEIKLRNMKHKYHQLQIEHKKHINKQHWPYFDLCSQAFQNDVQYMENLNDVDQEYDLKKEESGILVIKKPDRNRTADPKVVHMLQLYLDIKQASVGLYQEMKQKYLWENIAHQMDSEDADYWRKRFLNFKNHYIRMIDKRNEKGPDSITWPYMDIFDKIYADDKNFTARYLIKQEDEAVAEHKVDWKSTEALVLAKYYFDCFKEFQDPTIPNSFLWNEIGQILFKQPKDCHQKYKELKDEHMEKYNKKYDINSRDATAIVLDNIISREIEIDCSNSNESPQKWSNSEIDKLVEFLSENMELLKDPVCFNICWFILSGQLGKSVVSCRRQWSELKMLYKSMLGFKKDNPEMPIDWYYMGVFDRIFDFGMDQALLSDDNYFEAMGIKTEDNFDVSDVTENLSTSRKTGRAKAMKILEFYKKNKHKFAARQSTEIWSQIAKELNMSATECAHRFRNLKQVYNAYLKREIENPEKPIIWPYYSFCKKIFDTKTLKSNLRKRRNTSPDIRAWTGPEIRKLLKFYMNNKHLFDEKLSNLPQWSELAESIGKSESSCRDKFIELRKSYRQIKGLRKVQPGTEFSWKYYQMFQKIYSDKAEYLEEELTDDESNKKIDDDDIQCIFVIPEEEEVSKTEEAKPKWTKKTKKRLLILYLNYLKLHKKQLIDREEMWKEISNKLDKTPLSCKKMFTKLKKIHLNIVNSNETKNQTPYYAVLEKIVAIKARFKKKQTIAPLTDIELPKEDIDNILEHYLNNLNKLMHPRFDNNKVWGQFAEKYNSSADCLKAIIAYIKTDYKNGPFTDIMEKILNKESEIKNSTEKLPIEFNDDWDDDSEYQLLNWYLENLEKFKNPIYVTSYLWQDASDILGKSPLALSKKMLEIRTDYRQKVKESPHELFDWKFADLCQKIYGTGKRNSESIDTNIA